MNELIYSYRTSWTCMRVQYILDKLDIYESVILDKLDIYESIAQSFASISNIAVFTAPSLG